MTTSAPTPTVGRYRLLAKVGEGGMGVVHLAEAPGGGQVAVKVLRPHVVGDDEGRARMAREVTSLRRVRSPRIAEVYDADPWGDTPYVVTRYVPGPSLHERIRRYGPIAGEELLLFARGLAEAVAAVHAADVLHRDVKPSNVLLDGPLPVLIDFGLAQLTDDSRMTMSGWMLGTPGYLAPEILYGEQPTKAADVHSWAATVVFAATGRGPYGTGPAAAVMDRVRRAEHDLDGLHDDLHWLASRALAPDPADRPTASQLVDWLGGSTPQIDEQTRLISAGQLAAPGAEADWQPARQPSRRLARATFGLAVLAVFMAAVITAPVVSCVAAFASVWVLRTVDERMQSVAAWRRSRGARRSDGFLAALCLPWFAAITLPGALVNVVVALMAGAVATSVGSALVAERWTVPLVAAGGLVMAVLAWWGPMSAEARRAARWMSGPLVRRNRPLHVALAVLAVAAIGCLTLRELNGPRYEPLPEPPWHQELSDLVS